QVVEVPRVPDEVGLDADLPVLGDERHRVQRGRELRDDAARLGLEVDVGGDPRALPEWPEPGPREAAPQAVPERALGFGHADEQQEPPPVPIGTDATERLDPHRAVDAALQPLRAEPPADSPAVALALEPAVGRGARERLARRLLVDVESTQRLDEAVGPGRAAHWIHELAEDRVEQRAR